MPLPPFPVLPDDDPLVALRRFRAYVSSVVRAVGPLILVSAMVVLPLFLFALACLLFGFDDSLSWTSDLIPFTFAVISVLVSVKTLRDEHHNIVIGFVLFLGLASTIVIHYAKTHADDQHQRALDALGGKVESVGQQNIKTVEFVSSQASYYDRRGRDATEATHPRGAAKRIHSFA